MKQTVDIYTFRSEFERMGRNNFSHDGLEILFDYLEEYEASCGEELELDVVALCCDYSEDHWEDIAKNYDIDLSDIEDEEDKKQAVMDYLCDNTSVCGETDTGYFVYASF